ncbi:MAG TPA: ATP-binding protein [Methylomirabilota bacterium]|nr:ATP-binding protein [Methylomirabilota bacterium]
MDAPNNVLVVEDDVALSKLVGELLNDAGYKPVTIADHALIGAAVERWQPRLVILDGEVRDTGEGRSWDDAVAIRRAHPEIPVVMFSAHTDDIAEARAGVTERSRAASFAGIVGKPFVVEEFLATVKSVVEGRVSEQDSESETGPYDEAIKVFPDIAQHPVAPPTDFLATVVHQLRAPLTVIKGQTQLARRYIGQDPARERAAIDSALSQIERMAQLISDLLNQSRINSNALSLSVVAFDLASAVVAAMTRHQYAEPARITFQRPPGAVAVRGDPNRIAEILDNLLDNAIKYSAENAPIEVWLRVRGTEAVVRVTDHGVGVPASERSMLFTPFFRTSRTAKVHGTGLGLHISQQLAKRHGGRLWLQASSDAGSVFALALPLKK